MRVSIVGNRSADSLEGHLADSFRALGHDARVFDIGSMAPKLTYWAARFVEPVDRQISRWLAGQIAGSWPDLVVVVYRHLHPVLVDVLRANLPDVPLVQVNPDALSNLEKGQIIAADFDAYFSKEPYMVEFMRQKAGLNAHYLPEGFNPRVHRRPTLAKAEAERQTDIDVLVYGSLYPYRARLVEQLLRAGINVVVCGTAGPYLRPAVRSVFRGQYLTGETKNQLLYGARIVLNTLHYAEITSVNQKYFEINGIGGFQLCDDKPTIAEYSAVESDAVTYRTTAEAIERIRYYLARPDERHDLAELQYHHFQQHHTFDRRVSQLLRTIGMNQSATHERHPV